MSDSWRKAGFLPGEAHDWWRAGFEASEAAAWRDHGFEFGIAESWTDHDFDLAGAVQWSKVGIGPEMAAAFYAAGMTLEDAARWVAISTLGENLGNEPELWWSAGFYNVDEAEEWARADFSAREAAELREAGLTAAEAIDLRDGPVPCTHTRIHLSPGGEWTWLYDVAELDPEDELTSEGLEDLREQIAAIVDAHLLAQAPCARYLAYSGQISVCVEHALIDTDLVLAQVKEELDTSLLRAQVTDVYERAADATTLAAKVTDSTPARLEYGHYRGWVLLDAATGEWLRDLTDDEVGVMELGPEIYSEEYGSLRSVLA